MINRVYKNRKYSLNNETVIVLDFLPPSFAFGPAVKYRVIETNEIKKATRKYFIERSNEVN